MEKTKQTRILGKTNKTTSKSTTNKNTQKGKVILVHPISLNLCYLHTPVGQMWLKLITIQPVGECLNIYGTAHDFLSSRESLEMQMLTS